MSVLILDLHIHSYRAQGASKFASIDKILEEAKHKGIDVLGSGDLLDEQWEKEVRKATIDAGDWFEWEGVYVVPSVEVNLKWAEARKIKQAHFLLVFPLSFLDELKGRLSPHILDLNTGRPDIVLSPHELKELVWPVSLIIPTHAFTPWFGLTGMKCQWKPEQVLELKPDALETGLSASRDMIRAISALDSIPLVSFSDAHSASKIGREVTVIDGLDSGNLIEHVMLCVRSNQILYTLEFPPELGKYYESGHRRCQYRGEGICPQCGRQVTVGAKAMISKYADREQTNEDITCPPLDMFKISTAKEVRKRLGLDDCEEIDLTYYWFKVVRYSSGYDGQHGEISKEVFYA